MTRAQAAAKPFPADGVGEAEDDALAEADQKRAQRRGQALRPGCGE
ncbi:hypothetical protein [Microtetraspora malaysiensis]